MTCLRSDSEPGSLANVIVSLFTTRFRDLYFLILRILM